MSVCGREKSQLCAIIGSSTTDVWCRNPGTSRQKEQGKYSFPLLPDTYCVQKYKASHGVQYSICKRSQNKIRYNTDNRNIKWVG